MDDLRSGDAANLATQYSGCAMTRAHEGRRKAPVSPNQRTIQNSLAERRRPLAVTALGQRGIMSIQCLEEEACLRPPTSDPWLFPAFKALQLQAMASREAPLSTASLRMGAGQYLAIVLPRMGGRERVGCEVHENLQALWLSVGEHWLLFQSTRFNSQHMEARSQP